ncbi:MAG TPA: DUF47 domain-containing protein [Candidatus Methylomirabilis sp.]|jgi:hypothetical protein|nr:DUF47 domain-containing protein [Candidatus Methylomirabilis sp.]
MFRLIPREEKFFDLFEQAAGNILAGAQALEQLIEAGGSDPAAVQKVEDLEHQGDRITHEIIRKLHRSFITPIDREDIHGLTKALDDCLDLIWAVAARTSLFRITETPPEARRLARLIADSCGELTKAIRALREMRDMIPSCVEIHRLENEADDLARAAIARLFEGGHSPIDVIKWKEIYETMETATDRCEDAANIVEGIFLKNA